MNYLYFAEGALSANGDGLMFPANRFTGIDPISSTTTRVSFQSHRDREIDDEVLLTHADGKHKDVAELIAYALTAGGPNKTKFIVVADELNGVYLDIGNEAGLNGVVECTITQ